MTYIDKCCACVTFGCIHIWTFSTVSFVCSWIRKLVQFVPRCWKIWSMGVGIQLHVFSFTSLLSSQGVYVNILKVRKIKYCMLHDFIGVWLLKCIHETMQAVYLLLFMLFECFWEYSIYSLYWFMQAQCWLKHFGLFVIICMTKKEA